jgi:hypothetical protein
MDETDRKKLFGGVRMHIGDKIYKFEITLDFLKSEVNQNRTENSVIGINDERLVMNDKQFTTLELKKTRYNDHQTIIRKVCVWHSHYGTYWDKVDAVFYTTNNSEKIAKKTMKKQIEKFMFEKFGKYAMQTSMIELI